MRVFYATCLTMVLIGAAASAQAGATEPLGVGDKVPVAQIQTLEGQESGLKEALGGKPTVLIFYRGGWCPYCNRHLSALAKAEPALKDLGFQIVGISPDRPEELQKTIEKQDLGYTLLSDTSVTASKAFGLAFEVDAGTLERYKGFGIDLEKASGKKHNNLPIPAAYLVDSSGTITFAHVDPDYKKRIDPDALLKAARGGKE